MRFCLRSHAWLAVAAAAALSGCGGSSPTAPSEPVINQPAPTPSARTVAVNIVGSIGNGAYNPNPVTANAGDIITFRNADAAVHHIVLDDGSADFGAISPGGTSQGVTLRSSNAVNYHCVNHPSMVGSINGATAPEPPVCPDPYGYGC